MRSTAFAISVAGVLASHAAGLAHQQSYDVSLASIETESVKSGVIGEAPADRKSVAAELPAMGNPLWAIPISKLSATRDRPLFSASRRPRTPAVAAAPTPLPSAIANPVASDAPPFSLVGTIIGENSRIAIFLDEASKTATGIKEGERISGWTLRTVDPRSTILEGSGRTVTLDLPEPAAQANSATPIAEDPQ